MKAAVVHEIGKAPAYGDYPDPVPESGEVMVHVRAAALTQLTRLQSSGRHYTQVAALPFVPGADGVGVLDDGQRTYFAFPRRPFGSMAERSVVQRACCAPVPGDVDDVSAAALGNPGMSSWAALTRCARLRPSEAVLINGATGASGRLAIQIARHLGAGRIVTTGRGSPSEGELRALGADVHIALDQPPDALGSLLRREIHDAGIDIVLDYLWGPPAASIMAAAATAGAGLAARRIRFVQVGTMAGDPVPLSAGTLRTSGLELMGSGLGSLSNEDLVRCIGEMFAAAGAAHFSVRSAAVPLRDVEAAWSRDTSDRIVITM
jgi:NADPH:quinone reductase-like Zn-dependent oxidoreductase